MKCFLEFEGFHGTTYFYAANLQGDIVAILDSSGAAVVKYTYDAWGKLLTTTGSMKDTLGKYNPLRYRGYVYDTATGLYYLQSRYYDPEMGRFINADVFVSTGTGLLGYNMFTYCNGNPIRFSDPSGYAIWGTNTVAICDGGTGDGRGINPSAHKSHNYIPAEYDDSLSKDIKDTYNAAVTWIDNNWKHVVDGITTVVGLGCSVVGTLATASIIAIPIGGQIILGVTGIVCSVWSAGRYFEIW